MLCPYCLSHDIEEVVDDRYECNSCEETFNIDEVEEEYDDGDDTEDDRL